MKKRTERREQPAPRIIPVNDLVRVNGSGKLTGPQRGDDDQNAHAP